MLENVVAIRSRTFGLSTPWIYVYVTPEVPLAFFEQWKQLPQERLQMIRVERKSNSQNMTDRFLAIDDPTVDIMIVRDADSRVYDRDASTVNQFLSSEKHFFHIIRDYPTHHYEILGGMWGMKKQGFQKIFPSQTMNNLIQKYYQKLSTAEKGYGADQHFLKQVLYPQLPFSLVMIHNSSRHFEKGNTPFLVSCQDQNFHFIGQSYEADNTPTYTAWKDESQQQQQIP
jgi:hypothetical protein